MNDGINVYGNTNQVKPIGIGGGFMTRYTKIFAVPGVYGRYTDRVKRSADQRFRNVTSYFFFRVKLLLNWKSGDRRSEIY